MKKITLVIAITMIAQSVFSQVAGLRGGLSLIDGTTFFGPGASFQYGLNDNVVLGLNLDYHIGESSTSLLNIEPRIDYYFNSAFDGFHIGSNISYLNMTVSYLGESKSAGQMAIGGLLGYTMPINDKLIFDISSGGAYLMDSKVFAIRPTLTLGYKLGN